MENQIQPKNSTFRIAIKVIASLLLVSCSKAISFPNPVDTTTKPIQLQERKIFAVEEMGVYATNKFLGANMYGFSKINDSTINIAIRPENTPINNSPYYSFKIWSLQPKTVYVKLDYPKENEHRYHPKIKKPNNEWETLKAEAIKSHNNNTVIKLALDRDTTWVSAQEVISSVDTEQWIFNLIRGKEKYVHLKSAGISSLGKDLPVLDIFKTSKKNKDLVVLLTRQHPPEVSGFFAFQHFLSAIVSENQLSSDFLAKFRVIAFPILNPDGVDLGHWRHNANGVDLNRDWSKYRQPEIRQVVDYINDAVKRDKCKLLLGLDFHSTYKDVFYTNIEREKTTMPSFIDDWFSGIENNLADYKVNEKVAVSKKPVSKGWFLAAHNAVGITFEIGDETPRNNIQLIGKAAAEEMMRILLEK